MLIKNFQLLAAGLSLGLALAVNVKANAAEINTLTEFYQSYGNDFSLEEKEIIEGIFENVEKYLKPNGLQTAIDDGFVPFTRPWYNHGTHWFNPSFVDITNLEANPFLPVGLNVDKDGNVVGGFWAQELYAPITPFLQSLDLGSLDPAALLELYTEYQTTVQPIPNTFAAFGETAQWHTHKNVVIENIGAKNEQGQLDSSLVQFRQSLSNESFIHELIRSLTSEEIVLGPIEQDLSLGYPFANQGLAPGFYMIHMWFGLFNEDGLWFGTNNAIAVSENAIDEAQTFEDGSDGHDHNNGGDMQGNEPQSVPEPSSLMGILVFVLLGLKKLRVKYPKQ